MNYYRIIFWTIFLICIPITVPFIILGSFGRIIESAYFYGYDSTNDILNFIAKKKDLK